MMKFIFALPSILLLAAYCYGQTSNNNNKVQPYSIAGQVIKYTPSSQPIIVLTSSSRRVEVFDTKHIVPAPNGRGSKTAIVIKDNGNYLAFPYYSYGPIKHVEQVQLNDKGLPELILHTYSQEGNAYWSNSDTRHIVVDLDSKKVLWDLCVGFSSWKDNKEENCNQSVSFSKNTIEVGSPKGNSCNSQNMSANYKTLTPGKYKYDGTQFVLSKTTSGSSSTFEESWKSFQSAIALGLHKNVVSMCADPFYSNTFGRKYYDKSEFASKYNSIIDDDTKQMIAHAKVHSKATVPKKPNANGIEYPNNGSVTFEEIKPGDYLDKVHTALKLNSSDRVYKMQYNYDQIIRTSGHPNQSVTNLLYFAQTADGFKFCGKGLIF